MSHTRRNILTSFVTAAAGAALAQRPPRRAAWKPKLGVLGQFSENNLTWVKNEGFTSMGMWANRRDALVADKITDAEIEKVKDTMRLSGLHFDVLGCTENHINADADQRARSNAYFAKVIELAGKLGIPYVGTASGTIKEKSLDDQVSEIVRVYTEKYFPVCEKYRVRILWEPWAGGPNIATGPVGYEALFKAFGNAPVGLQYDPSHLVWQMMDPIQCARDFVDKIYDVHLKDTEIRWEILRKTGINPLNNARWWRFRVPGSGQIDWKAFFTVLMDAGFDGAMNIEHEADLYRPSYNGHDFGDGYKTGFRVAHQYLKQFVPA